MDVGLMHDHGCILASGAWHGVVVWYGGHGLLETVDSRQWRGMQCCVVYVVRGMDNAGEDIKVIVDSSKK